MRRRFVVMGAWFALTILGAFAAGKVADRWLEDFSIPGASGYEANQRAVAKLGNGELFPFVLVLRADGGDVTKVPGVEEAIEQASAANPGSRVSSYFNTNEDVYVSEDRSVTFANLYAPGQAGFEGVDLAPTEKALAAALPDGVEGYVSGVDALYGEASEGESGSEPPSVLVETMIGALGALVILLFTFGTVPAIAMPLLIALVSILNTFTLIWLMTYITDVSIVVQFLVALIGLGVAIDYALLMIFRFREELRHGRERDEALVETMTHAGRSVIVSGSTVAVGLLSMIIIPLPFIRSIGIGGMLIPAVSVLTAITLLPALLYTLGPKVNSVRVLPKRLVEGSDDEQRGFWNRWARFVVRRPIPVAAIGLGIVAVLLYYGVQLNPADAKVADLPGGGRGHDGAQVLADAGITPGVHKPFQVVVEGEATPEQLRQLATRLVDDEGIAGAAAPPNARADGFALVEAFSTTDGSSRETRETVTRLRDDVLPAAESGFDGAQLTLAGFPTEEREFISAVYGNFVYVLLFVILLTYVLLMRAFRSVLLPLKAVILNLDLARRGLRDDRLHLPEGQRLGGDLERARHRFDHLVDPADDLRVPVRALDGLRGLPAHADAGDLRRDGRHRSGDRARARADGQARHERCARPDVRLLRPLDEPRHGHQAVRDRPRRRNHLRRDGDPGAARAGDHEADGRLELVAAVVGCPRPPRRAELGLSVRPRAGRRRRGRAARRPPPPRARAARTRAPARRTDRPRAGVTRAAPEAQGRPSAGAPSGRSSAPRPPCASRSSVDESVPRSRARATGLVALPRARP